MEQLTTDFEARFRQGDTPWEDPYAWHGLEELFQRFVPSEATILDVGCGLGTNAIQLGALGYRVVGIDVSASAIETAETRRAAAGVSCVFRVADFLAGGWEDLDVVFDRGCFHGFADGAGRSRFAATVASALKPAGLWIDISGSSDNGDSPERVRDLGLPRLTIADMTLAIEPYFETVEIRGDVFGQTPDTDFRAFVGVFRRREHRPTVPAGVVG